MLRLFNQVPGDGLLLSLKFKCFFSTLFISFQNWNLKHIYKYVDEVAKK